MAVATPAPPRDTAGAGSGLGKTSSNGAGDAEERKAAEAALDDAAQIAGTGRLFDVGGKKPTGASLTITGGKFSLTDNTGFDKGTRLRMKVEDGDGNVLADVPLLVDDVGQKDSLDTKTGQVIACEQRHKARVIAS